jgi:hypothetical protein
MRKSLSTRVPLIGLVIILSVAYGLDDWIETLRESTFRTYPATQGWLVPENILHLFISTFMLALILGLLWLIYIEGYYSRAAALIYVLVGLGITFYFVIAIPLAKPLPILFLKPLTPKSMTLLISSIVSIVGLQQLFAKKFSS